METENGTPRVPEAPAAQSGQDETGTAAPIRNPDAYERSQAAKAARLAGKSREEVEALKGEIASLKDLLSSFVSDMKAEKEARAAAEKTAQREQLVQAVATKFHLPAELAKRLQGETAEALEADAAELATLVQPPKPIAPTVTRTIATGNVAPTQSESDAQLAQRLVNRIRNGKPATMRFTQPYNPDDNPDLSSGGG